MPEESTLPDIRNRADVSRMIRTFYALILRDELLAPKFAHVDLEAHFPVLDEFWCMILLQEGQYTRNAFDKHLGLGLEARHFDRWLELFTINIDAQFSGSVAEMAKQRANSIAWIFRSKMGL